MDYFIITKEGKTGVKSSNYSEVVPMEFKEVQYDRNGAFIVTGTDGMKGYTFWADKTEVKYTEVRLERGGQYALLKAADGTKSVISSDGNNFFEN